MLSGLDRGGPGLLLAYALSALGLWLGVRRGAAGGQTPARPALLPLALLAVPATLGALGLIALLQGLALPHLPRVGQVLLGLPCIVLISAATGAILAHRRPARVLHLRGAQLTEASNTGSHAGRPPPDASTLLFAGQPIPALAETKHFKLLGTTGTGKSTAIRTLLAGALARGDRALIADPDASYLGAFYEPARGDQILNPFEPRAAPWDLFAEIEQPHDADALARAFIPDHDGSDRNWRHYARTFVGAVLRQLQRTGAANPAHLYQLLFLAPAEELRALLAATPAAPFLGADNGKFFESVRSIAGAHLAALEPIARQHSRVTAGAVPTIATSPTATGTASPTATGTATAAATASGTAAPLCVRHWVRAGRGVLFLPYRAGQIAALRQLISAWMRLAIFETMNREEGDQPLWFILDELDALGAIDGLKDALARLRKFGGRCVLGLQSIAQVRGTYGDAEAQTIIENCGNTLILRCSASEHGGTAQFASRLIGRREIAREQLTRTRPVRWGAARHETRSRSFQIVVEDAVMPSEIEQLPDRQGFLKLASQPAWYRVEVPLAAARTSAPPAALSA